MRRPTLGTFIILAWIALMSSPFLSGQAKQNPAPTADRLVYADFENCTADHLQSSRGGYVFVAGWQKEEKYKPTFDPIFVDAGGGFSNRMAFNFKLFGPQEWTGVGITINGLPEVDGKTQPEDLSGYKELVFDVELAGPPQLKIQLLSQKTDLSVAPGNEPFVVLDVKPGFQTYRIPLKKFDTPRGSPVWSADVKKVIKAVTGLQFAVEKQGSAGHVLIDNVEFRK